MTVHFKFQHHFLYIYIYNVDQRMKVEEQKQKKTIGDASGGSHAFSVNHKVIYISIYFTYTVIDVSVNNRLV